MYIWILDTVCDCPKNNGWSGSASLTHLYGHSLLWFYNEIICLFFSCYTVKSRKRRQQLLQLEKSLSSISRIGRAAVQSSTATTTSMMDLLSSDDSDMEVRTVAVVTNPNEQTADKRGGQDRSSPVQEAEAAASSGSSSGSRRVIDEEEAGSVEGRPITSPNKPIRECFLAVVFQQKISSQMCCITSPA